MGNYVPGAAASQPAAAGASSVLALAGGSRGETLYAKASDSGHAEKKVDRGGQDRQKERRTNRTPGAVVATVGERMPIRQSMKNELAY